MTFDVAYDVNIVLQDFPEGGNEMVCLNEDGSYTILINARLSRESQVDAYVHAIDHIEKKDFQKTDVQSIEYEAHNR